MKKYGDILDLKRPISKWYAPMDTDMRAAQFVPFAALTGFEDMLDDIEDYHLDDVAAEIGHEDFFESP